MRIWQLRPPGEVRKKSAKMLVLIFYEKNSRGDSAEFLDDVPILLDTQYDSLLSNAQETKVFEGYFKYLVLGLI